VQGLSCLHVHVKALKQLISEFKCVWRHLEAAFWSVVTFFKLFIHLWSSSFILTLLKQHFLVNVQSQLICTPYNPIYPILKTILSHIASHHKTRDSDLLAANYNAQLFHFSQSVWQIDSLYAWTQNHGKMVKNMSCTMPMQPLAKLNMLESYKQQ
jgi:hypothetical protein